MDAATSHQDLTARIEDASEPLIYNSMVLENYLRMIRMRYPQIDVDDILKRIKLEPWEMADPAQWLTQQHYNALYRELSRHFPPSREISLAREAGRFAGTDSSQKLLREAVFALLSPTRAYDVFDDIARRLSRAADYTSRRMGRNRHQITITYKPDVEPQPFQCENYTGYLEAIFFLFERKWPRIEHPHCHFRGDRQCTYLIAWDFSAPQALNRLRNLLIALTAAGVPTLFLAGFFNLAVGSLVFSSITGLSLSLLSEFIERRRFFSRVRRQRISPREKVEGYDRFYNYARLFNEISRHLSKHTDVSQVLEKLSQILQGLGYARGITFIVDQTHDNALFGHPFGLDTGLAADLRAALETVKSELHKIPPEFKKPQVIGGPQHLPAPFPDAFKTAVAQLGEMIYIPMTYENSVLGFFLVAYRHGARPLMASDINLLTTLASQTALSVQYIAAFESLLRNEQLKNEFVAVASHELRTPIQIILLALEEMQTALPPAVRQDMALELDAMGESARRLEHIVRDILDINKLETRKSNLDQQAVSPQRLIKALERESEGLVAAGRHQVNYRVEGVETITCDPDLMTQTLTNLINNAAKYTPAGGRIDLVFSRTGTDITIDCIDNGIGVPREFQEKIFMKFFQVEEALALDRTGCGLGLSLCREIIKKHGGYIEVESPLKPDEHPELDLGGARRGTRFGIHLAP